MKNSIFVTGDIHGDIRRILNIPDEGLTKNDIVIVLGDFGVIWNNINITNMALELLGNKKFTTAFLDGNHENFNMINDMQEIIEWNGGRAGILPFGIIHLLRGEIYNINNKIIGICGGANSIDKAWRVEGESWWKEEEISDSDIANFEANLLKYNNKIDIMLTHDIPVSILPTVKIYSGINNDNMVSNSQLQLEKIDQMVDIKKWYFGHWHIDKEINDKYECFFKNIKEV